MIPLGILASSVRRTSAGDPHWPNVASLLHFDDLSAPWLDQAGVNWEPASGAALSPGQGKFGSAHDSMPGNSSKIIVAGGNQLGVFGLSDFTVEAWLRLDVMPTGLYFSPFGNWSGNLGACIFVSPGGVLRWHFGPSVLLSGVGAVPSGVYIHVAYSRYSGNGSLFVNGSEVASGADTYNYPATFSGRWVVGGNGTQTDWWRGLVDEFRVTDGVARYTENFTPPTEPFPDQ